MLLGWGLFNTFEGGINHFLLGLHHVNEFAADPLRYDWAFQCFGAVLLLLGWHWMRSAHKDARR